MLLNQAASANIITIILYVVVFGAIIYFMMIRPQKKQQKEAAAMHASMQAGDSVLTTSGFYGVIIDVMDNFIPLISLLSSELEKKRINMINDLKSILLKSSEEVDVFIKIFESWIKKLPSISGPVNLYIPTSFKDKYLEVDMKNKELNM